MTTQENQTHSENDARIESTESPDEPDTGTPENDRSYGNRRTFLQGVGIVSVISLSGCAEVTFSEDGVTWRDDDEATDTPGERGTDAPDDRATEEDGEITDTPGEGATEEGGETTEEDDELDLSEYEDGCFSGGTPSVSEGVRDGVEITVSAAGIDDNVQLLRETVQFEYNDDLVLRDDIDLIETDEEEDDEDSMVVQAEWVEVDEEEDADEEDGDPIVIQAEIVEIDEEDDEEDDDE